MLETYLSFIAQKLSFFSPHHSEMSISQGKTPTHWQMQIFFPLCLLVRKGLKHVSSITVLKHLHETL